MLRNLIRRGVHSLGNELAPRIIDPGRDQPIATYCQDTVWPAPGKPGADTLRLFGATVVETLLATAQHPQDSRRDSLAAVLSERFGNRNQASLST